MFKTKWTPHIGHEIGFGSTDLGAPAAPGRTMAAKSLAALTRATPATTTAGRSHSLPAPTKVPAQARKCVPALVIRSLTTRWAERLRSRTLTAIPPLLHTAAARCKYRTKATVQAFA